MIPFNDNRQKPGYFPQPQRGGPSPTSQSADSAFRILYEPEKLLSDPKQTATALLAVKYGIFESTDTNLSYNLMALSKLLSEHPSAWNVVDQSLIDKVRLYSRFFFSDFLG